MKYYWWMGARMALWRRLGCILVGTLAAIPVMLRLHRSRVDLVCTSSIVISTGALAAWIGRKPHVWFIHEFIDEGYGIVPYLPLQIVMRLVDSFSRVILASSETIRRGYSHWLPKEKIHVDYSSRGLTVRRRKCNSHDS
jgi:hypothetical protein